MKLLITSGGTREAIDPVRYLSNGSTGATGAALANALVERGHEVTLLHGVGAVPPNREVATASFLSADDLGTQLRQRLSTGDYAAVIMAAAVSDYRPQRAATEKLSSDAETLTLQLVRNPKLLPQLRAFSPHPIKVIGFKLTVGADVQGRAAAVEAQFSQGGVDAVVHNDLEEIRAHSAHPFHWFTDPASSRELAGVPALAETLDRFLGEAAS